MEQIMLLPTLHQGFRASVHRFPVHSGDQRGYGRWSTQTSKGKQERCNRQQSTQTCKGKQQWCNRQQSTQTSKGKQQRCNIQQSTQTCKGKH